jgi:hypothetical protein
MPLDYAESKACKRKLNPDNTVTITGPCVVTGKEVTVILKREELTAYNNGAYIQDAFKSLSADDREFLMSGHSAEGWKLTFGEEEDM